MTSTNGYIMDKHREKYGWKRGVEKKPIVHICLLLEHKGKEVDVMSEWAVFTSTESKEIKRLVDNKYKRTHNGPAVVESITMQGTRV